MNYQIFIDTGGTFTDCIALKPDNKSSYKKVLSDGTLRAKILEWLPPSQFKINTNWQLTRDIIHDYRLSISQEEYESKITAFDPHTKILTVDTPVPKKLMTGKPNIKISALEEAPVLGTRLITETALDENFPPLEMRLGSTKGTNALLENKGSRTALFITRGFKDLLSIGDQTRSDIFAKKIEEVSPLTEIIIEVDERIDHNGNIIAPLATDSLKTAISRLKEKRIESCAVSLMNGCKNPMHENKIRQLLSDSGMVLISTGSELSSQIKILERTQTAVVNAYLAPVIHNYLRNIAGKLDSQSLKIMTSAGGLAGFSSFYPKDSLLSGPAGGVVGASMVGKKSGFTNIISLDMGGTSTDVSRYNDSFDYRYEFSVGNARIMSPALAVETVAAGGGSICGFDGFRLFAGPSSAGAYPGPACYGEGGPLTLTDVNLLLGKLSSKNFSIPVDRKKSLEKLEEIQAEMEKAGGKKPDAQEVLLGFVRIANETMAGAIKKISLTKGFDPADHSLVSFGGAGGLHACGIAENLGMKTILIPKEAGLLSAWGIAHASMERFVSRQILKSLSAVQQDLSQAFDELGREAMDTLIKENIAPQHIFIKEKLLFLRYKGQDNSLEIPFANPDSLVADFQEKYFQLFGHRVENRDIEVEAIRVLASEKKKTESCGNENPVAYTPIAAFISENGSKAYQLADFRPGAFIKGPALLLDDFSTFYLEKGWTCELDGNFTAIVRHSCTKNKEKVNPEAADLELFARRFMSIPENMGAMLQRTALSVNIKERKDFSCALLDENGYLVANAPHIPVHLGGLGICVREILKKISFRPGDTVITNHPALGGSHLPDVTSISPVFDAKEKIIAFVVNRAHHSEIGGTTPGSMPPSASSLPEEGVVIPPFFLVREGNANWEGIKDILSSAPYPSRSIDENLADLNASLAANMKGISELKKLLSDFGEEKIRHYFSELRNYAAGRMRKRLSVIPDGKYSAEEFLDDDTALVVNIRKSKKNTLIDFFGSGKVSPGNMNATPAIVHSVVIYVMRLLLDEDIPLNDGLLDPLEIRIPEGLLNPAFPDDIASCPAVVGGNVEISMRLTDTLLKAFGTMAASQGTMNNVLFGNDKFGYYETLAGGTGAGEGFHGSHAKHHHMTNTRITDPEILEHRYPVRLQRFEIRQDSGGQGKWKGGNGLIREYEFLDALSLSILSQRRKSGPYGLHGGGEGAPGEQYVVVDGKIKALGAIDHIQLKKGDRFVIKTPGGGACC